MQDNQIKFKQILEITTSASILFTIFFLFYVCNLKINRFDVALFTITSPAVLYSFNYYLRKHDILDEIVAIIFAYLFALIFYFVLTHEFNFIIVFYALIVYIVLKKLNRTILEIFSFYTNVENPLFILISALLSSFLVSMFLCFIFI